MTQNFANDNYYAKGWLLSEVMTDGEGNKYVSKESEYKFENGWTGAHLTEAELESDTARVFAALDKTVQMFYEGQSDPGKQTSTEYKYDTNGNITDYIDHGDDTPDDDLHATITYHSYPDKYLIGSPEHITVKDGTKTLRERKSVIDLATGNVTQIKQFLSEDEIAIYDMEYDQLSVKKMYNDMYGSTSKAELITESAIAVLGLFSGRSEGLSDGMRLDFSGMSKKQLNTVRSLLQGVGYNLEGTKGKHFTLRKIDQQ